MANVSFKRGSQTNLASATVTDGTFYLTTDTHRLYIGQKVTTGEQTETKLFPVNEGVITVADVAALQNIALDSQTNDDLAGSFYYATKENILCVWNGKKWVQINPDTNTYITTADWNVVKKTIQLVLGINNTTNTIDAPKINFVGDNVTVTPVTRENKKEIDVKIDVPDLGVTWTAADGSDREKLAVDLGDGGFSLIGGQNIALTKSNEGNNVTISATDMRPTGATILPKTGSANGYNVVVNMPGVNNTTAATTFNPRVEYEDGNYLYFKKKDDDDSSGTLDLKNTYYTKAQVDNLITAFNAVEYKGVWPPAGQLNWSSTDPYPTTDVKNGSMYMVRLGSAPALPKEGGGEGEVPKIGDLIIAQGAEGTNGYLSNITWVRIPSGDEAQVDTTYSFKMYGNSSSVGVNVQETGSTNATAMFRIAEGNKIDVTRTGDSKEIVVSHESTEFNASTSQYSEYSNVLNSGKISVLTGVSRDGYGHISGTNTAEIPAPIELNTVSSSASIDDDGYAQITTSLTQKYINSSNDYDSGNAKSTTFKLAGEGLDVSASGNKVTFSLTWGEF